MFGIEIALYITLVTQWTQADLKYSRFGGTYALVNYNLKYVRGEVKHTALMTPEAGDCKLKEVLAS